MPPSATIIHCTKSLPVWSLVLMKERFPGCKTIVHHDSLFIYIYIYLKSPLPFVFGVVCKTPLFWVLSILFGVVSCKKGLLSSKQLVGIYTMLYQAESCERFVFFLFDVGSATLTQQSDPGAWLKLLVWTTLDPQFLSQYKMFACFLQWAAGANMCTSRHFCRRYTGLSTSVALIFWCQRTAEIALTDGRTDA